MLTLWFQNINQLGSLLCDKRYPSPGQLKNKTSYATFSYFMNSSAYPTNKSSCSSQELSSLVKFSSQQKISSIMYILWLRRESELINMPKSFNNWENGLSPGRAWVSMLKIWGSTSIRKAFCMFAGFQTYKEVEGIIQRKSIHSCHGFNINVVNTLSFYIFTHTHVLFLFPACIDDHSTTDYFIDGC